MNRIERRGFRKGIQKKMKVFQLSNLRANNNYEMKLYNLIQRDFGFQVTRQYRIGFYFLDILILNRLLAIEVDGSYHNSKKIILKDRRKEALINRIGFNFLRIRNEDVENWEFLKIKIESFPMLTDHALKFKNITKRIEGHIGYCLGKMSEKIPS